jgi:transposase-like protein
MARPSKLSPEQWSEIERRLSANEKASDLAREFGVNPSQITRRVTQVSQKVREVAQVVAQAQTALAELPPAQQYNALSLAAKLRSISDSLASAAELGAKTAHRLQALANTEVGKVDDVNPLQSVENLKGVSALTKLANDSASIALNLLAANKETVKRINDEGDPDQPGGGLAVPVFNVTLSKA